MPSHSQERAGSRIVLAVLSGAAFMASLDLFIVNVALNDIGRDFGHPGLDDLSWVLNAYAIVYAALLIPLGRMADRFGRKGGFLFGLAVFTAASAACAASADTWMLVGFRVLQAAGAAALTPTSLGLLLAATPAAARLGAVRVWAASGALAAAAGPVVGGLLVIGVSMVVAVLGTPGPAEAVDAFRGTWAVIAAVAAGTAVVALRMSPAAAPMRAPAGQPSSG